MIETITLDMLTQNSVSVKKQSHVEVGNELQPVGEPWRRTYVNSAQDRQRAQDEVPDPYKLAIFAVWGTEPMVDDSILRQD